LLQQPDLEDTQSTNKWNLYTCVNQASKRNF